MAAAERSDKIDCSFKLKEFRVPAAISAACGAVAIAIGLYFLTSSNDEPAGALVYSAVNMACAVPFFAIALGYVRLVSARYRMEINPHYIVWPLPNAESLNPLTRRHVRIPNTEVVSVSIMGNPDGDRGLVLLVRKSGRRFLVGLPSLGVSPAQLAETFKRNGYSTSVRITGGTGSIHKA